MTPIEEIARVFADGLEQSRKESLGPNAKMLLLREEGEEENKPFSIVRQIVKNFSIRSNDYFGTITFRVGDVTESFADDVRRSTHLIIKDSKIPALNHVVFEMKSSTAGPDSSKPFWRIRGESLRRTFDGMVER